MTSLLKTNIERYRRQGKSDAWLQSYQRGWHAVRRKPCANDAKL